MADIERTRRNVGADAALADLACHQHGVFSRAQALSLDVSEARLKRALRCGALEVLHRGVYRSTSSPKSFKQSVSAAVLWGGDGSCASARCAARLWGLDGFDAEVVEVSSPRNLRSGCGVIVHRAHIAPHDVATVDGIATTTVARTLLDVAGVAEPARVELALDDALRRRMTTVARLRWRLNHVGAKGKAGAALLRSLLDERWPASVAPESALETKLMRLLTSAGVPAPERQWRVVANGKVIARVDFAYPTHRLAVEADGYRYHSSKHAWERDLARRNALGRAGWRVVHVTSDQLKHHPEDVVATVRALLR